MTTPRIVIVDYGVANVWSAQKALRLFAPETVISEDRDTIASADALVLPGVGAFKAGMEGLAKRGLTDTVRSFALSGKPVLGICLGAQLLMEKGFEFGECEGLGIIKGEVRHFPDLAGVTMPNIGWRPIRTVESDSAKMLFEGVPTNAQCYFVHSFELKPSDSADVLATTTYGGYDYCAVLGKGKVYGTQFHTEKSGPVGLQIIKNFVQSISA